MPVLVLVLMLCIVQRQQLLPHRFWILDREHMYAQGSFVKCYEVYVRCMRNKLKPNAPSTIMMLRLWDIHAYLVS